MGEVTVARWRRYGKDRLYVSDAAGARIGWVDLVDGSEHVVQPGSSELVRAAAADFCRCQGIDLSRPSQPGQPGQPGQPDEVIGTDSDISCADRSGYVPVPAPTHQVLGDPTSSDLVPTAERDWVDLALNVPGQAARAQAVAELAAAREHSRVGSFLARAFDVKTDERAWRVGAGGEETVGARLGKLRKHGWEVLHAVPVGDRGSDIDHLLVGPGGVWTINTKTHPGGTVWVGRHQVRVNGHKTNYLRNSRFEADRASRLLTDACGFPVVARAALVFLTGSLIPNVTIKQEPDDVAVLDRMDIPRAFRRAKGRLTAEQVAGVYEQARRSTTWTR